ncbi:hypothetical protein Tco_0245429 [Tanacetum coccineum]
MAELNWKRRSNICIGNKTSDGEESNEEEEKMVPAKLDNMIEAVVAALGEDYPNIALDFSLRRNESVVIEICSVVVPPVDSSPVTVKQRMLAVFYWAYTKMVTSIAAFEFFWVSDAVYTDMNSEGVKQGVDRPLSGFRRTIAMSADGQTDKAAWLKAKKEDWRVAEETRVWFKLKPF